MDKQLITISDKEYGPAQKPGKNEFKQFIDSIRKETIKADGCRVRTRDMAEWVGIGYDQFRKIVNRNRQTDKRDFVIAVCLSISLSADETNEALRLYNDMPPLNTEYPRDNEIIDILEEQAIDKCSLEQINQRLVRNGFSELNIQNHTVKARKEYNSPYAIIAKKVRCQIEDLYFGDQYNSLATEYDPRRFYPAADMWIEETESKKRFKLTVGSSGSLLLIGISPGTEPFVSFSSIDETGVYKDYFLELKGMATAELKRQLSRLDDTLNYGMRKSARIIDNSIHVFMERYNYQIPELGEYYLMEYCDGKFSLSISRSSMFMRRYLSTEEYNRFFGRTQEPHSTIYHSEEDISKKMTDNDYILNLRLRTYRKMRDELEVFITDLKEKKVLICNTEYIFSNPYEVLRFFHVEEAFQCSYDEYGDIAGVSVNEAEIYLDDGRKMTLSIEDLEAAFEIGLSTITEVFDLLQKHHTLKISNIF